MSPESFARRLASLLVLALLLAATGAAPVRAGVNVWTPIGPEGGPVFALRIDRAAPATLYAGTLGGVFKSLDGGASWTLASRGLGNSQVFLLTQDPRQPGHLFAVTADGPVFRSLDAAATWQALPGAPAGLNSLVADPASPHGLLASAYDGYVWQSADGGTTWQKRSDRRIFGLTLLADPQHPGTLYASANNGEEVLASTDGGATWIDRNAGLPKVEDNGVVAIDLDPEVPTTLYAAILPSLSASEQGQLYVSRDSGGHWQSTGQGGFPVATGPGGAVYTSLARSLDHGQTWTDLAALPQQGFGLAVSPVSGTRVYATASDGLYASADGAASWQRMVHGLTATPITALAVRPGLPTLVLAGVEHIGVFRGRPSGQAWRLGVSVPYGGPPQILFDPANPAVAYTEVAQKLLRSTDAGLTWEEATQPPVNPRCSASLRTIEAGPGTLYAGFNLPTYTSCAQACGMFKSVDQGQSWTCLSLRAPEVRSLAVAPSSAGAVVYAVETTNLWKSADGGKTWALQNRGWQRLAAALYLVTVDPTRADTLYLSSGSGLLKSTDGARTFTTAGRGLPTDSFITAVLVDPAAPSTVYVGEAFHGVYRSVDGGRRWSPQVGGLHGFSGPLALDPLHPSTLYAGTPGNGVYTITFAP